MHKICNKYAVPHNYASYEKICKNMQKMQLYARYANMIFICKICTPHFADGAQALRLRVRSSSPIGPSRRRASACQ